MVRPRPFLLSKFVLLLLFFVRFVQLGPVGPSTLSPNAYQDEEGDDLFELDLLATEERATARSSKKEEENAGNKVGSLKAQNAKGTSGHWTIELESLQQEEKEAFDDFSSEAEASTLNELLDQQRVLDQQSAVDCAIKEISMDRMERMDPTRYDKSKKEFEKMEQTWKEQREKADNVQELSMAERLKLHGTGFNLDKFKADVAEGKQCNEEPLQVAEYYLFRYSSKMGVNHAALFVCGIEIHFHHPGIQFWKPMEYSTKYDGGYFRDYRTIFYNGKELKTQKSFRQIVAVVNQMKKNSFNSSTYSLLTHNCLLFLRTLTRKLTGLTNGEQIDWPWSAIHPLKKPVIKLKKPVITLKKKLQKGGKKDKVPAGRSPMID